MNFPIINVDVRLFLRLFIGFLLLSVSVNKLKDLRQFRQGIRDYQVLPAFIESSEKFLTPISLIIALGELIVGLTLITGIQLTFSVIFTQCLFFIFSGALSINLVRGRKDLSCHCGGALGNHFISWWLVVRNVSFILGLFILLLTPPDPFTLNGLSHIRSASDITIWINIALPVAILALSIVLIGALFNTAKDTFKDWH
jgi:Methylamine utilisation protein MauE